MARHKLRVKQASSIRAAIKPICYFGDISQVLIQELSYLSVIWFIYTLLVEYNQ